MRITIIEIEISLQLRRKADHMSDGIEKILHRGKWKNSFDDDCGDAFIIWEKANIDLAYSKRLDESVLIGDPVKQLKGLQYKLHRPVFRGIFD